MSRLTAHELLIVACFFKTPEDFVSLVTVCRKCSSILEKFRYNPLPDLRLFPRLETQYVYSEDDSISPTARTVVMCFPVEFTRATALAREHPSWRFVNLQLEARDIDALDGILPPGVKTLDSTAIRGSVTPSLSLPHSLTSLRDYNLYSCTALQRVVASACLRSIGNSCFAGCKNLTTIEHLSGITALGENAFDGCCSLLSLTLPPLPMLPIECLRLCTALTALILDDVKELGRAALSGCFSLSRLRLPPGLTALRTNALADCTSLRALTLPTGLAVIEDGAFSNCASIRALHIPDNVTTLGRGVCANCAHLKSVTLPAGLPLVPERTFAHCQALTHVALPPAASVLGASVFDSCKQFEALELPPGLTRVGARALKGCRVLSLSLPPAVREVDPGAFAHCGALTAMTLPAALTRIDASALHCCTALQRLVVRCPIEALPVELRSPIGVDVVLQPPGSTPDKPKKSKNCVIV